MRRALDHAIIWFAWWLLPARAAERVFSWLFTRRNGLKCSATVTDASA